MISARRGEFETGFERGGQTREHAMLVKTAGVKHLVVVVNKMDDSTVMWDEERYVTSHPRYMWRNAVQRITASMLNRVMTRIEECVLFACYYFVLIFYIIMQLKIVKELSKSCCLQIGIVITLYPMSN